MISSRASRCAAVALAFVTLAACGTSRTGPSSGGADPSRQCLPWWQPAPACPVPSGSSAPAKAETTGFPTYTAPKDGRGWSTQLLDQPRPLPGSHWKWTATDRERGLCQWATPDLLAAFGWSGRLAGDDISCRIALGDGQMLQIDQYGSYHAFGAGEEFAFIRPILIAGLEAREYDFAADQEHHPGSCTVQVNTRSLSQITVLAGTADGSTPGTDPALMCQRARDVATLMVRRFVPLAGGTPWPPTPQQPKPGVFGRPGYGPCDLFRGSIVWANLDGRTGQAGTDGPTQTCTWSGQSTRAVARLTLGAPSEWPTVLPPLADRERTSDTKLGVLPARLQLTPDGHECADAVQYAPGEVLRVTYRNPAIEPAELCRTAKKVLGDAIGDFADFTA